MKLKILLVVLLCLGLNNAHAQEENSLKPAQVLLDAAYNQASLENKNVFIFFHASWCGWCHKMEKQMKSEALETMFAANYIFVYLDVNEPENKKDLENPGASTILAQYGGEKAGMPYWLILDQNATVLTTSYNNNNQNLGCPASDEEVLLFTLKLKETSELDVAQLALISEVFLKK